MPAKEALHAQHAVELGGVAARLVDLDGHLARVEDDGHLAGWTLGRLEQRDGLLASLLPMGAEVQVPDGLEAAAHDLTSQGLGIASLLAVVLADGGGVDPRPARDQFLLGLRTVT